MIVPERRGIQFINATSGDGGGTSPIMELLKRKITKINAHLRRKCLGHLLVNHLRFLLAHRTLKIAEHDDRDRRIRRTEARRALDIQLVEVGLERALVDVVDLAAE